MANLAQLMGGEASGVEITREIDPGWGFTFEATFDPTGIPADATGMFDENDVAENAELLCRVIKRWDLDGPVPFSDIGKVKRGELVPEGKPIPLDPTIVVRFPPTLLIGILQGLVHGSFPKSATTKPGSQATPS